MTFLNYLFTRTCLFFASIRSAVAKRRVLTALQSTKAATGCIGASYEKFLLCAADRESLTVRLKRCMREKEKPPILDKQIDTGTLSIPDTVKQRLTRYEMEMALARHRCCDWGEIDDRQWQVNNRHTQLGCGNVSSVFDGAPGSALRITTDLSARTTQLTMEVSPYAV